MRFSKSVLILGIAMLISNVGNTQRAVFYETFDEFDSRNGGSILPEGVERSRFSGRLPFTEVEIEAPAGESGETEDLARWIPDPTGLSLTTLLLDDQSDQPSDNSLGADGAVSLLESILLDQGDNFGRSVVSWMAIAQQTDQPGGTMFPETDTVVDAGPEGLNLIGFGGIFRDFDTGDPLQDLSGFLTLNAGESAQIESLGIPYEADVPVFFVLDFDLDASDYDLYINGILIREDIPFFGMGGETGRTLRELELISSARGFGSFIYDNLIHIDPDTDYEPVDFQIPMIAQDAPTIPLYMEEFDDNQLGSLSINAKGDLPGSQTSVNGIVEVIVDQSQLSLAEAKFSPNSSFTSHFTVPTDLNDNLRYSFKLTPPVDSSMIVSVGDNNLLRLVGGGNISIDTDGDGVIEAQDATSIANLPHWVVIEHNTFTGEYDVKIYRALSESEPQTTVITLTGQTLAGASSNITFSNADTENIIDNIFVVEINETPNGSEQSIQRAVYHQNFDNAPEFEALSDDPTQWSSFAMFANTDQNVILIDNENIQRSARAAWSVIPDQQNIQTSVLNATFDTGANSLVALLADGTFGIDVDQNGEFESTGIPYTTGVHNFIQVVFDLSGGTYEATFNNQTQTFTGNLDSQNVTLQGLELSGNSGGTLHYDNFLVVQDHYAAFFEAFETDLPVYTDDSNLLFAEDFENKPARSHRLIDEFQPRRSGLPIPTATKGISDPIETNFPGSIVTIGAPSAAALYDVDPDGSSLYALVLQDEYSPMDYIGFESALPINPISTLRTIPYSFYLVELADAPQEQFVHLQWAAQAKQTDQTGLALFTDSQIAAIQIPNGPLQAPAPAGTALVAFGENGNILIDLDGDGELDESNYAYVEDETYRFKITIDRPANSFTLSINDQIVTSNSPLAVDASQENFLESFGWFSTLVQYTEGAELQQSPIGGGNYVIDDIRVIENATHTSVTDYWLY